MVGGNDSPAQKPNPPAIAGNGEADMTKIQTTKFIAIANKLGLKVLEQPSQFKITGEDPNKRLYVPGTKTVHKVELSGFTSDLAVLWTDVYPGKKAPSGKITHILDFSQPEKEVLKAFFKIAKGLAKKQTKAKEEPASSPVSEVLVTNENLNEVGEQLLMAADQASS